MKNRDKLVITFAIFGLLLLVVGVTYAYFTAIIAGKETASSIVLTGGVMTIDYSENSNVIQIENIYPREEAWFTKTITLTGTNTTDLQMKYDLGINVTTNTFSHYLSYDLTLLEGDNGTPIANITNKAIVGTGYKRFGIGVFNTANAEVHNYELKIYLKDNGLNQNEVQNGVFNAKVVVEEARTNNPNEEIAMFLPGQEVNIKMKNLANEANNDETVATYTTENTTITAIQRSNTLKEGLTEENIVSTDTSVYPIYIWYEDGIIYYYTEADRASLNSDASDMFLYLSSLTDISGLTNLNTSNVTNMYRMFAIDSALPTLNDLSNWDVSNVTNMSQLFTSNSSLTSLEGLENWNTSSVTDMSNMFSIAQSHNPLLADLSALSNWDVSNVTNMDFMFENNTSLTILNGLENWDVSNVTTIKYMFNNTSLITLNGLENWDVSSVTDMFSTFSHNASLTDISALSNWNVSNVTNMVGTFNINDSLTTLHGLENWDVSNVQIMQNTFNYNSSLTDLSALSNWNTSNLTNMRFTFENDTSLTKFDALSNWNTSNVTSMYWIFRDCTNLVEVDISGWDLRKLSDANDADLFYNSTTLERLKTPKAYPTKSKVKINLPVTLKDDYGTSYTSLGTGSPTSTWLTK